MKNNNICETTSCHSTCILRLGLGFVFVYFSVMKLFFGAAPPVDKIITFMPVDVSLFLLGLLEFVIGVLLVFGLWTRVAGWAAAVFIAVLFVSLVYLQFSGIMPGLWSAAYMAKDVALLTAGIAVGIQGAPCCSIDVWMKRKAD